MKHARITYTTDYQGREGYIVEIKVDPETEYGLDTFFPLVQRKNATEDEGQNYVHFSLVNKIHELYMLGYRVIFA